MPRVERKQWKKADIFPGAEPSKVVKTPTACESTIGQYSVGNTVTPGPASTAEGKRPETGSMTLRQSPLTRIGESSGTQGGAPRADEAGKEVAEEKLPKLATERVEDGDLEKDGKTSLNKSVSSSSSCILG